MSSILPGRLRATAPVFRRSLSMFVVLAAVGVTSACMTSGDAGVVGKNANPTATLSSNGVLLAAAESTPATPRRASSRLELIGKGPKSSSQPTYICGVSGGGIKSRCYQL